MSNVYRFREYWEFPVETIKQSVCSIYPRKGYVVIDGFKRFKLKELKKIDLNFRLSFPSDLFAAIHKTSL